MSELTSTLEAVEKFAFEIGELDGVVRPRLETVKEILSAAGGTTILTNLMGIRWTKLLMNATFSGMSAALGCSFRDVLADEKAMTCIAHIADETIKVCHGKGYRMVEMQGADMEFLELGSKADIAGKMDFYRKVWGRHNNKASMLQDLEKGNNTEIDHINGVVCRSGRECGLKNSQSPPRSALKKQDLEAMQFRDPVFFVLSEDSGKSKRQPHLPLPLVRIRSLFRRQIAGIACQAQNPCESDTAPLLLEPTGQPVRGDVPYTGPIR